ncbi:MAG: hypothetical protein ABI920_11910 [Casimicrobiaceae bacterium]
MRHSLIAALGLAILAAWWTPAHAERKTVCSITVNSPDERETLRRYLPKDEFEFVELVERGRPDWLESACRKAVRCDVLLISGHFDGGTEFYSDRLDARESLPVAELERASCSTACSSLFSRLREVYLFGCNTLNAEPLHSASGEIRRSLVRAGYSADDVERLATLLDARHGDSNRDVMRHIFGGVPVIYGFSGKAPLGRYAAATLDRYFQAGQVGEVGSGRADARLLGLFAPVSMTSTTGVGDGDTHAAYRQDVCQFADDGRNAAQKIGFIHSLLQRDVTEARLFLDRIERYTASLSATDRDLPDAAAAWGLIREDVAARTRFLEFARDADRADVRARMLGVAREFGWLSRAEERGELLRMFGERLAADRTGAPEVELACALNQDGELGAELDRLKIDAAQALKPSHAAVLACLGSAEARARVLRALTSPNEVDVQIAQVYLNRRPVEDAEELRSLATDITRMRSGEAQVLALDTLGRHRIADRASLEELARLFASVKSLEVQRAVAGILIRADYPAIATPELLQSVRQSRVKVAEGHDAIDILIRRLELVIAANLRVAGS